MQSRQWDSTVFNDTEEAGNGGNQIDHFTFTVKCEIDSETLSVRRGTELEVLTEIAVCSHFYQC